MNCKIFRLQLDNLEASGSESSLPPDMRAHVEACGVCREHFQLHRRMLAVLETDAAPALPSDFTAKIFCRFEPAAAPNRAKTFLSWKRAAIYAGYAFSLALALWFGYKNINVAAINQLAASPLAQQIQQWLAGIGAPEIFQAFQNFLTKVLSFIPISGSIFEKAFGKEVLPRAFNLAMILMLTFVVAKASVFFESWVRQISRRSS